MTNAIVNHQNSSQLSNFSMKHIFMCRNSPRQHFKTGNKISGKWKGFRNL